MSAATSGPGTCGCCGTTTSACASVAVEANRPGLPALSVRAGTHAAFLARMKARLSAADLPALAALRTREASDFSIALLDAWAIIGDVLTFYQERIANEGYLRTASERLSVVELARLLGFELRPGVASSVYLAYTLNQGPEVRIPAGARTQSTPGPGEKPQFFETSEDLVARADWNSLQVRRTRLPAIASDTIDDIDVVNVAGAATNLKPGDRLLFAFESPVTVETSVIRRILSVEVQFKDDSAGIPEDRTVVRLVPVAPAGAAARQRLAAVADRLGSRRLQRLSAMVRFGASRSVVAPFAAALLREHGADADVVEAIDGVLASRAPVVAATAPSLAPSLPDLVGELRRPPTRQPPSSARLVRDPRQIFRAGSDVGPQLLRGFFPEVRENLYLAFATPQPVQEVFVFRQTAFVFGHNAPKRSLFEPPDEGPVIELAAEDPDDWGAEAETGDTLFLDNGYPQLLPGDLVLVESPTLAAPGNADDQDGIYLDVAADASVHARTAYRVSGPTTEVRFASAWWAPKMETIRDAVVYTRAEKLPLAREPVTSPVGAGSDDATTIELDRVYPGLSPGRWIIVSGQRIISDTVAIPGAELVMLAAVEQRDLLPARSTGDASAAVVGDPHTVLTLAGEGLAFTYQRDSLTIFGNVVQATHGETRGEVLGSGDATRPLQTFTLKKPPITYVPAATATGVASTLEVRVNDIVWRQAPSLAGLGPNDRRYIVRVAEDGTTSIIFGTGEQGARLPTGVENVTAVYRSGIGRPGNVEAGQVNVLQTRPLGVKEVVNPLRASGGADPDTVEDIRRNAPESVIALERLLSVSDYAAFARSFAGIAKAAAARTSRGRGRPGVHVTISGQENVPIDPTSLLFRSLVEAFGRLGDPALPIELTVAPLAFVFVSAGVRIAPDRVWEVMVQQIRAALLGAFGFDRRDLGQSIHLSEVIATIQQVPGVEYVDVDSLAAVGEADVSGVDSLDDVLEQLADGGLPEPPRVAGRTGNDARLLYLNPSLPDLLILREITS
jgi:uncharacterized phage protein gp47/JayE